jgi:hypothetical protein
MPYIRKSSFPINPFLAWNELAMKTGEMMLASAQVIQHRTGRMVTAGPTPSLRDQREFTLMGQEKIEAIAESTQAMALQMMTMSPMVGLRAMDLMMKGTAAMMALATSTTIDKSLNQQAKLANILKESAKANSELSHSAAKIAHHGLKPIHSRATSNAKRLTKIGA